MLHMVHVLKPPSLWLSSSRPCPGLSFEVADAVIVSSDRHAFTVGLNVTVLSGSLGVGMRPMVPLDALLGGGRADKAEAGGWLGWMRCWGVDGPTRLRLVCSVDQSSAVESNGRKG